MMRKLFLIPLLLSLANCATTGNNVPPVVQQAQQIAQVACGFLPTAETILNILALAVPGLGTAEQIATAVCAAVGTPPSPNAKLKLKGFSKVHGVTVRGHFVQ